MVTRYSESFLTDLQKHNAQQREIKFTQLPHRNHDRFLIIDDEVYLLGASVKDMGVGLCAITKMQTTPETVLGLLEWYFHFNFTRWLITRLANFMSILELSTLA